MVLVHYIGGLDEEDEWIPRDSPRLREDKMAERRIMQARIPPPIPPPSLRLPLPVSLLYTHSLPRGPAPHGSLLRSPRKEKKRKRRGHTPARRITREGAPAQERLRALHEQREAAKIRDKQARMQARTPGPNPKELQCQTSTPAPWKQGGRARAARGG